MPSPHIDSLPPSIHLPPANLPYAPFHPPAAPNPPTQYFATALEALLPLARNVIADARLARNRGLGREAFEAACGEWGRILFRVKDDFFPSSPSALILLIPIPPSISPHYTAARTIALALLLALLVPANAPLFTLAKPFSPATDPHIKPDQQAQIMAQVKETYLMLCEGRKKEDLLWQGETVLLELCTAISALLTHHQPSPSPPAYRLIFSHSPFRHPLLNSFVAPQGHTALERIWGRLAAERIQDLVTQPPALTASLSSAREALLDDIMDNVLPLLGDISPVQAVPAPLPSHATRLLTPVHAPVAAPTPVSTAAHRTPRALPSSQEIEVFTMSSSHRGSPDIARVAPSPAPSAGPSKSRYTTATPTGTPTPAPQQRTRALHPLMQGQEQFSFVSLVAPDESERGNVLPPASEAARSPTPQPATTPAAPAPRIKVPSTDFRFNAPQADAVRLVASSSFGADDNFEEKPKVKRGSKKPESKDRASRERWSAKPRARPKPGPKVAARRGKGKARETSPELGEEDEEMQDVQEMEPEEDALKKEEPEPEMVVVVVSPKKLAVEKGKRTETDDMEVVISPRKPTCGAVNKGNKPAPSDDTDVVIASPQSAPKPAATVVDKGKKRVLLQDVEVVIPVRKAAAVAVVDKAKERADVEVLPPPRKLAPSPSAGVDKGKKRARDDNDEYEPEPTPKKRAVGMSVPLPVASGSMAKGKGKAKAASPFFDSDDDEEMKENVPEEEEEEEEEEEVEEVQGPSRPRPVARAPIKSATLAKKPIIKREPARLPTSPAHSSRDHSRAPNLPAGPTSRYATGANVTGRRPWTGPEDGVLEESLRDMHKSGSQVSNRWATILKWHGPTGTKSNVLQNRNVGQLKDRARNLKMIYERSGAVPEWFNF